MAIFNSRIFNPNIFNTDYVRGRRSRGPLRGRAREEAYRGLIRVPFEVPVTFSGALQIKEDHTIGIQASIKEIMESKINIGGGTAIQELLNISTYGELKMPYVTNFSVSGKTLGLFKVPLIAEIIFLRNEISKREERIREIDRRIKLNKERIQIREYKSKLKRLLELLKILEQV